MSPPASVWPAAALRFGGGGGKERRARATAPPPAMARQAAGVSGGEGRWCVAAGVCMAGGGSECWGGRRARYACTWFCSAAGVGKTGGGRVGWGGALVCHRRRRFCRRLLCVLGWAAGNGRVHVLLRRRRSWQDQQRSCRVGRGAGASPPASVSPAAALRVGGGGGQGTRAHASAPPPALNRPAADVSGEEGRRCVAAGVCMAGSGSACWGGARAGYACTCFCSAAGAAKTGGGRAGWRGALVCRRRRLYGRWRLGVSGGAAGKVRVHVVLLRRRRWKDRRRTCRVGRGAGVSPPVLIQPAAARGVGGCRSGSSKSVTGPPPELARPVAGASSGEGRRCVAAGACRAGGGLLARRVVTLSLLRRRRRQDRRPACSPDRGAGVLPQVFVRPAVAVRRGGLPPASVWPAAALRVGGGGWANVGTRLRIRGRCAVHRTKKRTPAQRGKKNIWHTTEQGTYTSSTTGTRNGHRPHWTLQQHSQRRPPPCCGA